MRGKKLLILTVLFFALAFKTVNAQEVTQALTPTPTPIAYTLSYPGILPGHPLYFLKEIRDAIWGFLISNPLNKAEFDLLQSDKNIQAVVFLTQQKAKRDVIFTTLSRAEDDFNEAIMKSQEVKKQGIDTKDFVTHLILANLKHQEVISGLADDATGENKKQFLRELVKIKQLGQKAATLQRK